MAALGKVTPALWFEHLFGFKEHVALRQQLPNGQIVRNPAQLREKLELRGERLVSLVNGASYGVGTFSAPSLSELRRRAAPFVTEEQSFADALWFWHEAGSLIHYRDVPQLAEQILR